jgi:hypothetical protein
MQLADPVEEFRQWDIAQNSVGPCTRPEYAPKVFFGWSEKQFIEFSIPSLSKFFNVRTECWGTCFPFSQVKRKRVRVDVICTPTSGMEWGIGPFAIEYKRPDRPATVRLGDHIAQALDYKATYWDGHGYMPVFMCPGLQGYTAADEFEYEKSNQCIHYESARRILGGLGIGEMFVARDGKVSLFMSAERLMVNERITRNAVVQKKAGRGVASASS